MKVSELLRKISHSYIEIAVNEYKGQEHTGRRYIVERQSRDYSKIPEDVMSADVSSIVVYYDRISIEVEAEDEFTTEEWCPYCNEEVDIPVNRASKCPECGEVIYPCSACDQHDSCHDCPFSKKEE